MIDQSVATIRRQKSYQFLPFGLREARADADVLQLARIVIQAKQKGADRRALASLVPSKAGHDAIAVALMLDLEHDALVRLIGAGNWLGHDAIEARAFKAPEPIGRDTWIAGCGSEMDWRLGGGQRWFQRFAPPLKRFAPPIAVSFAEHVEKDYRRRTLLGQQLHARRSWMNPQLQFLEIEPIILRQNDFAVEDASGRQLRIQCLNQFRKVAIQ